MKAEKPKLGKVIDLDANRCVSSTSEDRAVATMLSDNFVLATSGGKGDLLESRTKSFSIANKVEAKDAVSVTWNIRGFVSTQENSSEKSSPKKTGEPKSTSKKSSDDE